MPSKKPLLFDTTFSRYTGTDIIGEGGAGHSPGWNTDYPRIQIPTIEELLHNTTIKMPSNQFGTFKQAQRVQAGSQFEQGELGLYTG